MKKREENRLRLDDFHIAGFTHYEGLFVFNQLKIGTSLTMEWEEDNGYDPRAIAIFFNNTKIGFIPRANNSIVYKMLLMGHGDSLELLINRLSGEETPERQVGVTLFLKRKDA